MYLLYLADFMSLDLFLILFELTANSLDGTVNRLVHVSRSLASNILRTVVNDRNFTALAEFVKAEDDIGRNGLNQVVLEFAHLLGGVCLEAIR